MDRLKYYCAKSFNKVGPKSALLAAAIVGSSSAMIVNNDLDSYSTNETQEVLQNINQDMHELESFYNEIKQDKRFIKAQEKTVGEDITYSNYEIHNQRVDTLSNNLKDFEYDLMFSGLSEKDIKQVIEEYNGLKISNVNELASPKDMDSFNEIAYDNKEMLKYSITQNERERSVRNLKNDLYWEARENQVDSAFTLGISSILSFLLLSVLYVSVVQSKTLKEWNKIQPKNRKKKKLNITSPNKLNK